MLRDILHDDQGDRIEHLLAGREGHVGGHRPRQPPIVEAVQYRYRAGIQGGIDRCGWRMKAGAYAVQPAGQDWGLGTDLSAFDRRCRQSVIIDSTIVRCHQRSAG